MGFRYSRNREGSIGIVISLAQTLSTHRNL